MTHPAYLSFMTDTCFDAIRAAVWLSGDERNSSGTKRDSDRAGTASRTAAQVLIVEDELLAAWHVEMVVQDLGHTVCGMASRGEEAVKIAAELEPDIILMDVNLGGGLDGIEAAKRICAAAHVPVVFITAYSDGAIRQRIGAAVPGSLILPKPLSPEALRSAIAAQLGSGRG